MPQLCINQFKGIDQSVSENDMSLSFSPDACNMETENGELAVAKGYVKHLGIAVPGTDTIHRMYHWHRGSDNFFLVAAGSKLYAWIDDEWVNIYTYSETITSTEWDFVEMHLGIDDYLIIANGQAQLVKWNGGQAAEAFGSGEWVYEGTVASVEYNMSKAAEVASSVENNEVAWTLTMPDGWAHADGISVAFEAPSTLSTNVLTAKVVIGENTYALNYVPNWVAGEVAVVKLISTAAAEVSLDEYGITGVSLSAAIGAEFKQRALDVGMRIQDVTRKLSAVSDDRLTVTLESPCFDPLASGDAAKIRGELSNMHVKYAEMHFSRLFAAGDPEHPSRLYWSQPPGDARTIEDWSMDDDSTSAGGGHTDIGSTLSEAIVGLCSLSNQLLIFKESSIYRLLGATPDEYRVVPVNTKTERMYNAGLVKYGDTPFWLARSGMYYHDGSQCRLAGAARKIRYLLQNANLNHAKATENRDRLYFTFKRGTGNYDDAMIVYNMVEQTYMLRTGFHVIDIASYDGTMYMVNDSRFIYRFDEGRSYDGAPIAAYWRTPQQDLHEKGVDKQPRRIRLRGEGTIILLCYKVGTFERTERHLMKRNDEEVLAVDMQNAGRTLQLTIKNESGSFFRLIGGVEIEYDGGMA